MSMLSLLNELLAEQSRQTSFPDLYDQNFGVGLLNDEILRPTSKLLICPLRSGYLRPWRNLAVGESGVSSIKSDSDGLKINLDVQQFKPEELKVTVNEGYIVIHGKHEERSDEHGFISREFTRRYKLPQNVDEAALNSSLSSDGVLTLKAPPKVSPEAKSREIPITFTKQPAIQETSQQSSGDKMEQ